MCDPGDWLTARAACWTAILLCSSAALAGPVAAQDLAILRYEPLTDLVVTATNPATDGEQLNVSFDAFGTRFAMTLARNDLLTRNLPPETQQRLAATAGLYAGTLDGNAESWARLTRIGAELSGAIFDGTELYLIEPFGRVAPHVLNGPAVAATDPIIYRWADTLSALTDDVASPPAIPAAAGGAQKPALVPGVFDELAQSKLTPVREISIGLLGDSEFAQMVPGYAEQHLVSIANTVDGIFYGQLGLRIHVAELRTYAEPDAFSGTDPSEALRQVEDFKFNTPALRGKGLVHLVTGRDLDERPDAPEGARLLGVANFGAVCEERYAVGLTQFRAGTAAVVAAHEIAHNLGAPHDGQPGSPCESAQGNFLMSPFLSGSQQFSQCSLEQMEARLATATCLTDLTPIDMSVRGLDPPAEVVATRKFMLSFVVDYAGAADAADPRLTVTPTNLNSVWFSAPSQAACANGALPPMTCGFGRLTAAGGRIQFIGEFVAPQAGPAYLDIEVSAANDYTPLNNRYRFDFNVVPEGHFELTRFDAPVAVKPNEVFDVEWLVTNVGSISATNVLAELRIQDTLEIMQMETPSGAVCTDEGMYYQSIWLSKWLCPIGTMEPGANVPLKLKLRADDFPHLSPGSPMGGTIGLSMTAAESVFEWENDWYESVVIAPQIVDVHVELIGQASAPVGSKVAFTMRVGNRGPDATGAVNARLRSYAGNRSDNTLEIPTSSRGSCTKLSDGDISCDFPTLASGETIDVIVQATVSPEVDTHYMSVLGDAGELFDTDSDNNEDAMQFRSVAASAAPAPTPSPPPDPAQPSPAPAASGGGGGGGAVDLAMLLLLLGATARRLSRRRMPSNGRM